MVFKIGIVVSEFNDEITSKMLEVANKEAASIGLKVLHVGNVPGAFDIPLMVNRLLKRKDIDAVVTLGAVIRGETKHDQIIMNSVSKALIEISISNNKPVTLGITGPNMTHPQAEDRIKPVAKWAVYSVKKMLEELDKI